MTIDEAIKWQNAFKTTYKGFPKQSIEATDIAIQALEKQIPVKPIHTKYRLNTERLHHMIYCGNCGEYDQRVNIGDKYCRKCGTKIDWSDDE
jgi:hypothetical protein